MTLLTGPERQEPVLASRPVESECPVGFDALLARARSGDEAAWAELYDSLAPQVLGYLRAKGAADAEEVLGEVFLHVARGIDAFEGDGSGFRSWVFVIATSRLFDERRRARRKPSDPLEGTVADHMVAPADVQAEVEQRSIAAEVQALLGVLTDDQRHVVELRIFAGLTSQEVADIVGKPLGAVKALYRRGLGALRREIDAVAAESESTLRVQPLALRAPAVPPRAPAAVTGRS
jgi:RNA polymerase sigma-70 factor (ECF subfamily)